MRYRKLRIAWSMVWGVVAVLLIVLWVRSYSWDDCGSVHIPLMNWLGFRSNNGAETVYINIIQSFQFELVSHPANHLLDSVPNYHGFGILHYSPSLAVRVPHWLSVLFVSALGTLPWLRCRFTLRTLLVATTLIAIVLGLIVG